MKKRFAFLGAVLGWALALPALSQDPAPANFPEVMKLLQTHAAPFDPTQIEKAAMEAVIQAVDARAQLVSTNAYRELLDRRTGMLPDTGIRIAVSNGQYRVVHVETGSPAAEAGILENEILRTIDGSELAGRRRVEVMQRLRTAPVKLGLRAITGEDRVMELKPVRTQAEAIQWTETLPSGLGYLKLNGVYPGAAEPIKERLHALQQEKRFGLLLDLRDAGGQDLDAVAEIAGLYTPGSSTLFILKDRDGEPVKYFTAPGNGSITMPTMVLVNQRTTGAAEVLAATLAQSARGAMLFGETTSGDSGIREFIPAGKDYFVYLATRSIHLGDGQVLDGKQGITPDVEVADRNIEAKEFEPPFRFSPVHAKAQPGENEALKERVQYDAVLQRAVDVLLGLKALNIRVAGDPGNVDG